ncbi:MAG: hypothetical protein JXA68_04260 [Ignavibacteriales bacterium]|nr:hypothetical protein [Ignavibacteriales bacterium]
MENTFENALDYVRQLSQIDEGWSESEKTLASAFMSYAAKVVKNNAVLPHVSNNEADCKYKDSCGHDYCNLDECPEYEPIDSERYLLIEWIQGHPVIDGAKYADTKQELMDYYDSLPKGLEVEYTICRIYNVR